LEISDAVLEDSGTYACTVNYTVESVAQISTSENILTVISKK